MFSNGTELSSEILTLSENCQLMLTDSINAFSLESAELTKKLIEKDKENDMLHDASFQKIIKNS